MILFTSVVLAAVLGAASYLVVRSISLGASRRINDLEISIKRIQELADSRLSLIVRQMWGNKFLQFRSERSATTNRHPIELWMPKNGWSDNFHAWVVKKCVERNCSLKEFIDDAGNEFVVISFGDNSSVAASFAEDVLRDMFGMRPNQRVKVRIDVHSRANT